MWDLFFLQDLVKYLKVKYKKTQFLCKREANKTFINCTHFFLKNHLLKFVFYNNNLLFLKHDPWIGFQIGHVYFLAILYDLWMFSRHQPADMRKEKSPICIVRIGVRIGVFMVLSMISHPNIQTVLVMGKKI